MSNSKEMANLRDRLTVLENTPSTQIVTEALPGAGQLIGQGIKLGGKALKGIKNFFTSPAAASAQPSVAGTAARTIAGSPELIHAIGSAMTRYTANILSRPGIRTGFLFFSAMDFANWKNAKQNHDEKTQSELEKHLVRNVLGLVFPYTTVAGTIAMELFSRRINEPFTKEEEEYIAKTVAELDKSSTPPDPGKIEAKFYERIKNDYNKAQQQKSSSKPNTTATPAASPTPGPAAANTPAASTPSATPPATAAPSTTPATETPPTTTTAATTRKDPELDALLKAAGL
jgi:hypothetical protein